MKRNLWWNVAVTKKVKEWVVVKADTKEEAEIIARNGYGKSNGDVLEELMSVIAEKADDD